MYYESGKKTMKKFLEWNVSHNDKVFKMFEIIADDSSIHILKNGR